MQDGNDDGGGFGGQGGKDGRCLRVQSPGDSEQSQCDAIGVFETGDWELTLGLP